MSEEIKNTIFGTTGSNRELCAIRRMVNLAIEKELIYG
jgi:hypothetical protein